MTLSLSQVAIASLLMLMAVAVSQVLSLKLAKTLIIAAIRTVVQLSLVGLVLAWVFAQQNSHQVLAILTIMTIIASLAAKNRVKRPYRGLGLDTFLALSIATSVVAMVAVIFILQVSPWYRPQFVIPIIGLILGNSLTAISLTANELVENLHQKQTLIKAQLSLAATPFEAVHSLIITAITNGMMPTINSMMVVGVVSLPGMMTGQILAGADPTQAVRYQIVTMFFIAVGSTLSCTLIALLVVRRFFNTRMQFVLPMPAKAR